MVVPVAGDIPDGVAADVEADIACEPLLEGIESGGGLDLLVAAFKLAMRSVRQRCVDAKVAVRIVCVG